MDAADRGRLLFKLADLDREERRGAGRARVAQLRQDDHATRAATCRASSTRCATTPAGPTRSRARPSRCAATSSSYTLRQPVGVVGQIIPWNFPLLMLAWKWGPALACGNTDRHEARRADAADRAARRRAGHRGRLPRRASSTSSTASARRPAPRWSSHPDVDKIAFTGHVDTAKIIQKAAADTLKRTTFELGGKSPNVIFADCDMDAGRRRRLPRHLLPRRPVLHRGQPAVRRGEDPRGVRRAPGREGQGAQDRRPARPDDRAGPAGLAGADGQDPRLRRARPEAGGEAR